VAPRRAAPSRDTLTPNAVTSRLADGGVDGVHGGGRGGVSVVGHRGTVGAE